MTRSDLFSRMTALKREIAEIAKHNRKYFGKKGHTAREDAEHQQLRQRVYHIRAELYQLIEKNAA